MACSVSNLVHVWVGWIVYTHFEYPARNRGTTENPVAPRFQDMRLGGALPVASHGQNDVHLLLYRLHPPHRVVVGVESHIPALDGLSEELQRQPVLFRNPGEIQLR